MSRIKDIRDPGCTRCSLHKTAEFVCLLGSGDERSDIMIVGEAPGKREDDSGKPFVGSAGKVLEELLKVNGLSRQDVYITNSVNCRPPDNRTPKKAEINACKYWMAEQLKVVKPKYVLLLGATALQSVLDLKGIKKLRGKPIEKNGVIYLPTYHPASCLYDPNTKAFMQQDFEFFKEIVDNEGLPREKNLNERIVRNKSDIDEMLKDLEGKVSYDIETTGLYPWKGWINTLGFGTRNTQWILPTAQLFKDDWAKYKKDHGEDFYIVPWDCTLPTYLIEYAIEQINEKFEKGDIEFTAQNGKFDMLWTRIKLRFDWTVEFDTMLAHYLLDENSLHGLKYLSAIYFGAIDYDVDEATKIGRKGLKPLAFYQAHDLYYTYKLRFRFAKQLKEDEQLWEVFTEIMMPCVNLFVELEEQGVFIDTAKMDDAERYLRGIQADCEKRLSKHLPKGYEDINWGSTKQVGELLFQKLRLPMISKTPTGKPQVNESVLKQLEHPLVEALLELRGAKQQLSFFIEGWKPYLVNSRLHPSFKLHGTVTGRLSCENPNLQQVPRDPRIRSLITAPPGWVLLEADLSQIELRIAAELSDDRALVYAFLHNIDPHWQTCINEIARSGGQSEIVLKTASIISGEKIKNFGKAIEILKEAGYDKCEEVDSGWKELRKKAKAVNFGYLYGMWWKKFRIYAFDNYGVKVTDQQAQDSRTAYFELYQDLPNWHKSQKKFARDNGYVRSMTGRKRRLPRALDRDNTYERQEAERQAINSPVQSFANELNLMALIQLRKEFSHKIVRPVGTIHDAILAEVKIEHLEKVHNRLLEIMSHPELLDKFGIKLRIPVEADAKVGAWGNGVKLSKWKAQQNA